MTLQQHQQANVVRNQGGHEGGFPYSPGQRLAAAILDEPVYEANVSLPGMPVGLLEPSAAEVDAYTTHLHGTEQILDRRASVAGRGDVQSTTGLDMPLLGIARLASSKANVPSGLREKDWHERTSRLYILEVPPAANGYASPDDPVVMLASGAHMLRLAAARADRRLQAPVPGKDMPLIRRGEGIVVGTPPNEFTVSVSSDRDAKVKVHDRSQSGTDVIAGKHGKPVRALMLGPTGGLPRTDRRDDPSWNTQTVAVRHVRGHAVLEPSDPWGPPRPRRG